MNNLSTGRAPANLPPLNLLRTFDAAARLGNFTLAADELSISQSAVSQQIRQLEDWMNVRLFRRMPRRVDLTREGIVLSGAVRRALILMDQACLEIAESAATRSLCVNAAPGFASRWLMPRLAGFTDIQSHIRLTLLTSNDPVDLRKHDVDIAIRRGTMEEIEHSQVPLDDGRLIVVGSPALLQARGISSPDHVAEQTLLRNISGDRWDSWLEHAGITRLPMARSLHFNDVTLLLDAALQGQGLALVSALLVEHEIQCGRLQRVTDIDFHDSARYILTCRSDFYDHDSVRAFRGWILNELKHSL
ncbi:LysR family transcriptional regulator [Acetobacter sp. TBRC 12305]|uniref:LysR family transcriptional regulator n=1 Tax=Acetobacter garciniae TaxID=2817435 RepID=A0A939KNA1_9PROT|nr:LysR substrate-binding domain-containing protein [Acetobacter garciniae]MBO1325465.1 LysR family transcriptional regulator [Acetobacter garciniae]MBX0345363.1 LysR family transcriptional regulator [Acetobacter garciniae]